MDEEPIKVVKANFDSFEQLDMFIEHSESISRNNIGALIEKAIQAAIGTAEMTILAKLELSRGDPEATEKIVAMEASHPERLEQAFGILQNLYFIVWPQAFYKRKVEMQLPYNWHMRTRSVYLIEVVTEGVFLPVPTITNLSMASKLIKQLWVYRLITDPTLVVPNGKSV